MINLSKKPEVEMLLEQFIPDNVFVYVAKGIVQCYDGNKTSVFKTGECFIARKNRLARYKIAESQDGFDPVLLCFDEPFLKEIFDRRKENHANFTSADTFVKIKHTELIPAFIQSLQPYYDKSGQIAQAYEDVKYEELLIILLRNQPELAGIFFDFRIPQKTDLEAFMNRNFSFNVSNDRFAFLTGRSLSAFKRDFRHVFNDTPNRWLIQKRLQEAYFLIDQRRKRPSDIYLDLGFEALSHFSFAFKRQFGITPTDLAHLSLTK